MRAIPSYCAAAALTVLSFGCSTLQQMMGRPSVKAVHPRVAGIDLESVDLVFDLDVQNPYPVPIRASGLRYGLDIEGTEFIRSETDANIDLPAGNVGTVKLPIRLTYDKLLQTYRALADSPEAAYKLHGALNVMALGQPVEIPLSHSGKFPVLRPPRLSDVKVRVSNVTFSKARVIVDAVLENPNAFSVGVRDLGYALKVGDSQIGGLTATTAETVAAGQSGRVPLSGEVSASRALLQLLRGAGSGGAQVLPLGEIETPYGKVKLPQ